MPAVFSAMVGVGVSGAAAAAPAKGRHRRQSRKRHQERFSIFAASEWKEGFTTKDGWRGGKSCLLYLGEIAGLRKLAKTSHLDRQIPEYGAARLGLYERAVRRKVRVIFHCAFAMRGSDEH